MTKNVKNMLIILGVILEICICVAYGFEILPVPKTVCLLLWCLLAVLICRLADLRTQEHIG